MRPLPMEPLAGSPPFVLGVSVIRGQVTPVVDAGRLVGVAQVHPSRFVTVKSGPRRVALAVDAVLGVQGVDMGTMGQLPPLLEGADGAAVAMLGTLDAELLVVLEGARLVPDEVWGAIEEGLPA